MFYERIVEHFKVVPLINKNGIHYTIRVYHRKHPDMVAEMFLGIKSKNKYFGFVDEDGDICGVDDILANNPLKFHSAIDAINFIREEFGNRARISTWEPDL